MAQRSIHPAFSSTSSTSSVVVLDTTAPLAPNKAPPAPRGPLAAEDARPPLCRVARIPRRRPSGAERDGSDQKASHRSPRECHCLDAHTRRLPGRAEGIASLHGPRRHQRGRNGLEEQSEGRVQAGDVGAQSRAEGEHAG